MFSGLDVSDFNSVLVTPVRESRTSKLCTIISSNCFGFSSFFHNPFQQIRHMNRSDGKPNLNPN